MRLLLESYYYPAASFITLTYEPENLPYRADENGNPNGPPILCKRDIQLFMKRLRYEFDELDKKHHRLDKREIKYYFAGEYGPKGGLPHYHGILFGVDPFELDDNWMYFAGRSGPYKPNYCRDSLLYRTWKWGIVHVGEVTRNSIQYCAGYVTKKITKRGDGREPEFQIMSRRPGIGSRAVAEISRSLQTISGNSVGSRTGKTICIDGKTWPLGRYLLQKLYSVSDVQNGLEDYVRSLQGVWRESQRKGVDFLEFLVESDAQKFVNLESKEKLFHVRSDV